MIYKYIRYIYQKIIKLKNEEIKIKINKGMNLDILNLYIFFLFNLILRRIYIKITIYIELEKQKE
jgi:hypothetical protein